MEELNNQKTNSSKIDIRSLRSNRRLIIWVSATIIVLLICIFGVELISSNNELRPSTTPLLTNPSVSPVDTAVSSPYPTVTPVPTIKENEVFSSSNHPVFGQFSIEVLESWQVEEQDEAMTNSISISSGNNLLRISRFSPVDGSPCYLDPVANPSGNEKIMSQLDYREIDSVAGKLWIYDNGLDEQGRIFQNVCGPAFTGEGMATLTKFGLIRIFLEEEDPVVQNEIDLMLSTLIEI